jgi:hypothetical protein
MSLGQRLTLLVGIVALVPAGIATFLGYEASSREVTDRVGSSIGRIAVDVNDLIDRNLFERYGDVQAFATNPALLDRDSWYKRGAKNNRVVQAAAVRQLEQLVRGEHSAHRGEVSDVRVSRATTPAAVRMAGPSAASKSVVPMTRPTVRPTPMVVTPSAAEEAIPFGDTGTYGSF